MTTINVDFDEFQINVETQEQGPAGTGITWQGAYSAVTAYVVNDAVSYLGSSYICILASTNNLPTNITYWSVMASKGDSGTANITTSTATDISGLLKGASGFIAQAIADTDYLTPTTAGTTYVAKNVAITGATKTKVTYDSKGLVTSGADATTADITDSTDKRYLSDTQKTEATRNASGSQNGLLSSTDWTTFNSKEGALGFTPENVANKENTTLDTSATKYPTNRLVKEYADSLVAGLLDYRGGYDASVNTFPASGGSGTAGAVIKGDMWVLSVAGTLGGTAVQIGDSIIANVDTPGQTAGNWNILNSNISYVPEDQANKETSALDTSVTKYPCNNVVKSAIEARYAILEDKTSDYTANSTNSGKMWMRGDQNDTTIKGVIKTTPSNTFPVFSKSAYWKFDETNGTTASDEIGTRTITTNSTIVGGKIINARYVASDSDIMKPINPNVSSLLDGSGSFYCSLLINPQDLSTDIGYGIHQWFFTIIGGPNQICYLYLSSATQIRLIMTTGGDNSIYVDHGMTVGNWYHWVCTWNGTTLSLYRNGQLLGTNNSVNNTGFSNGDNTISIGGNWNNTYANDCYYDEVIIGKAALTQQDVTDLYTYYFYESTPLYSVENIPTKTYIDNQIATKVSLTGNETIAGIKTFSSTIIGSEIKAAGSAGLDIHNNSGVQVALFGAGGTNGTNLVGTTNIGSASADYIQIAGGTGTSSFTATGSSSNINVNIVPKGTGTLKSNGTDVALGGGTATGTNTGDETETTILSKMTVFADSKNDTGFFDNTNISVSYDKTARTITLTRTGGIIYYFQGKKYTLASPWTSSAHTNAAGNYYLYSTDGTTFSWSLTPWTFDNIMVALAIYDGADGWALREVHGLMDAESHKNIHNNIGTWRSSGGILTAGTYTENTASDAGNTPGFDLAVVNDEDLATTIPAWTDGTYTTMYIGAASTATFSTVATLPFTSSGSYIQVNDVLTGALTAGINNRYYNVYQILVPAAADSDSQKMRMIMLQPQATHISLVGAQAEDPRSLSLGNFATTATEFVVYARITYVTSAGDANTGKCRIATGGVSYVVGNRLSSLTGSPTNHAGLTNLAWTSSGHTGSNLGAPLFDSAGIATEIVPTAGQSVRINAGGTAWEAYTPGSGLSWGASVNGATGTGVALAMDNAYAASGIGLNITIGNTQTNALTGLKIDTGTDVSPQQKAIVLTHLNGYGIQSNMTSSQAVSYTYGFIHGTNYNTNSSNYTWGINLVVENNAGAGTNTGMYIDNKSTEFIAGTYAGLAILQEGVGGTAISVGTGQSVNTGTNGLVNYTLDNTQSGASIVQKIYTGTSTQSHIGLLVNAYNANTSCAGVKIDGSTTATGYGLEFAGIGASGYKRIRFSNQMVPAGGTSFGIHYGAAISATTGTGNGIDFAGTISGGGGGIGRGIYCATIADNTGGGTGVLIQVDNLIGASSTTAPTAAKYYSFNNNQSAILANLSVDPSEILFSRTCTRTSGTTTDNFNLNYLKRTSIQNGTGGTFSTTGAVQKLENVVTQTAGTSTDSTVVLSLVQDNDSTGGHILFNSYSGTPTTDGTFWFDGTDFKARVGGATKTFTIA